MKSHVRFYIKSYVNLTFTLHIILNKFLTLENFGDFPKVKISKGYRFY